MDLALVSRSRKSSGATSRNRPAYVSQDYQWDELHDIFVMLWPGMALADLMAVMEEDYGFRATKDQYKKKFNDWYKKGLLPPKKRRRGEEALEKQSGELEDAHTPKGAILELQHSLPTPTLTPTQDKTMPLTEPGRYSSSLELLQSC
ncbi:hypothetical protein EJ04DRAFT_219167 [Polyplosphaeria fusca]|uniref:Clr5 domain-containing protein n=1 Tax=Polyplosphaeria fusca TaxID=682080 RepID=A0A9P4R1R3_9PLEO|nr:hypothetical protein EJ04DRAFT_219167 [Polyplosphaeria fusca]